MCLIIATRKNLTSSEVQIVNNLIIANWKTNKDGAGFAYRKENKWKFRKGIMTPEGLLLNVNRILGKTEVVIHLRKTSAGKTNKQLTHPFPLTENPIKRLKGTTDKLLFQNGTVTKDPIYSNLSDTALLAWVIKDSIEHGATEQQVIEYLKLQEKKTKARFILIWETKMHFIGNWFKLNEKIFLSRPDIELVRKAKEILTVK